MRPRSIAIPSGEREPLELLEEVITRVAVRQERHDRDDDLEELRPVRALHSLRSYVLLFGLGEAHALVVRSRRKLGRGRNDVLIGLRFPRRVLAPLLVAELLEQAVLDRVDEPERLVRAIDPVGGSVDQCVQFTQGVEDSRVVEAVEVLEDDDFWLGCLEERDQLVEVFVEERVTLPLQ